MAENNQTNDITEMLMRLRASVEADRAKADKHDEPTEKTVAEKDEFELQLAEFAEEIKTLEKAEQETVTVEEVEEVEEVKTEEEL